MTSPFINEDGEVLELTQEFFTKAKPANEVLPQILGSEMANRLLNSKQDEKKSVKIGVFARYDPKVVAYFKATGKGWQTRMNDVLVEYVASH